MLSLLLLFKILIMQPMHIVFACAWYLEAFFVLFIQNKITVFVVFD